MFSEMVINLHTQHRNASRPGIFLGFDETLKQTTGSNEARQDQTQKLRYVDDNMENFQKISQAFPDLGIIKGSGKADPALVPGSQNSHDIAPIPSPAVDSALLPLEVAEHKAEKPENAGSQAEFTHFLKNEIEKRIIPDLFIENINKNTPKRNHQKLCLW